MEQLLAKRNLMLFGAIDKDTIRLENIPKLIIGLLRTDVVITMPKDKVTAPPRWHSMMKMFRVYL
jgi:hypothetical protein